MRRLLLLSVTLLVAACSDNQPPTSPANGRSVSPTGSAAGQLAPAPQAKPTDQVGFTKITKVIGPGALVNAGDYSVDLAQCPAGTVLTGGGYDFMDAGNQAAPPFVKSSSGTPTNGWYVRVDNYLAGAIAVHVYAYAYCAS